MKNKKHEPKKIKNADHSIRSGEKPGKSLPSDTTDKHDQLQLSEIRKLDENSPPIAANPEEIIIKIDPSGDSVQATETKENRGDTRIKGALVGGVLGVILGYGPAGAATGALCGALLTEMTRK